jgi:hypothetical protein
MAQVDLGWAGGKRQRKFLYGKTRQEVARKLAAAVKAHQDGMPMSNERITVEAFLQDWLTSARASARPKTWHTYECYIRLHALPALGRLPLAKLELDISSGSTPTSSRRASPPIPSTTCTPSCTGRSDAPPGGASCPETSRASSTRRRWHTTRCGP